MSKLIADGRAVYHQKKREQRLAIIRKWIEDNKDTDKTRMDCSKELGISYQALCRYLRVIAAENK